MKICELRFKNLNSLYGEWQINFESEEYVSGVFALVGQTGAGKSTVLDAICLALYGQTPRLGVISKTSNEIMSRNCGECYAEIVFETNSGRYRCQFEQHRASRKATKALQNPQHEIADAITGKVLESRKNFVVQCVEEKTGLDFKRFTRSILLAQGGFDSFLRATSAEKSRILEQITGTEIYSEISQHVFEKHKQEKDILEKFRFEMAGFTPLEEFQKAEIAKEIKEKTSIVTQLVKNLESIQTILNWSQGLKKLKLEEETLLKEYQQFEFDNEQFVPKRLELNLAQKAREVNTYYTALLGLRREYEQNNIDFAKNTTLLPSISLENKKLKEDFADFQKKFQELKEMSYEQNQLFQHVRSMDKEVFDLKQSLESLQKVYKEDESLLATKKSTFSQLQGELKNLIEKRKRILEWIEKNASYEFLTSHLTGFIEQLEQIKTMHEEGKKIVLSCNQIKISVANTTKNLVAEETTLKQWKQDLEQLRKQKKEQNQALEIVLNKRLIREIVQEKESLMRELVLVQRIASLEEHRHSLVDGQACPLCGSLDHPYALGNTPKVSELEERIKKRNQEIEHAEKIEAFILSLQNKEQEYQTKIIKNESKISTLLAEKKHFEEELTQKEESISNSRQKYKEKAHFLLEALTPLGVVKEDIFNVDELINRLRAYEKLWREKSLEKQDFEQKENALQLQIKEIEASIATFIPLFQEKQKLIESKQEEIKVKGEERKTLFSDKNVAEEEKKWEVKIKNFTEADKEKQENLQKQEQKFTLLQAELERLNKQNIKINTELSVQEEQFRIKLQEFGFIDEAEYYKANIPTESLQRLIIEAKNLDTRALSLDTRLKDCKEKIELEEQKHSNKQNMEELQEYNEKIQKESGEIQKTIIELNYILEQNRESCIKFEKTQEYYNRQNAICTKWAKLSALIGSADGKKFSTFAQGLTFECLISHANTQLAQMSDRYLLVRDEEKALELDVVDNYQAGEVRPIKNLSGGESFLISLALALGLSKMASKKVQVESLFLDEGFGSLDEDALDLALNTLMNVHEMGKMIGVISHVSTMKERIHTQIIVEPQGQGRSRLSGAGVTAL